MAIKARASITVALERDIQSVTRFYKIASSTSTPSKPSGTSDPSGWSKAEPAYDGTSTNSLYTVDRTIFTDGTASWSDVSKSSSYEAAKQAYNRAVEAENTAIEAAEDYADTVAGNAEVAAVQTANQHTDDQAAALQDQITNVNGTGVKDRLDNVDLKTSEYDHNFETLAGYLKVGTHYNGNAAGANYEPEMILGHRESNQMAARLTTTRLAFGMIDEQTQTFEEVAYFSTDAMHVRKQISFGDFIMKQRENGHLSILRINFNS